MTNPGDTPSNPVRDSKAPLEPKVKWGALGAYGLGVVGLALTNVLTNNQNELLIYALPDAVEMFVLPLVPGLASLVAGFAARHQWRSNDLTGDGRQVG